MFPDPALTLLVEPMSNVAPISVMSPLLDVMVWLPIVSLPVPSLAVPDRGESASNIRLWAAFEPVMLALTVTWRPACSVSVEAVLALFVMPELTVMSCDARKARSAALLMVSAWLIVMSVADIRLPAVLVPVGPVVAAPIWIVPVELSRPISALLRLSAAELIVIAVAWDGAT